jgi:hypothetical protein
MRPCVRVPGDGRQGQGCRLPRVRRLRAQEDDLLLWHRRRLEPDQGLLVGLYELLDEILQHLPLIRRAYYLPAAGLSSLDLSIPLTIK